MNLKEQQYVCTLARCQTISKAAEELYISPSALSVYTVSYTHLTLPTTSRV